MSFICIFVLQNQYHYHLYSMLPTKWIRYDIFANNDNHSFTLSNLKLSNMGYQITSKTFTPTCVFPSYNFCPKQEPVRIKRTKLFFENNESIGRFVWLFLRSCYSWFMLLFDNMNSNNSKKKKYSDTIQRIKISKCSHDKYKTTIQLSSLQNV